MLHKYYYHLENQHIEKNSKIALISDIHFSIKTKPDLLNHIVENLQQEKPDYICIPGDIIDTVSVTYTKKIEDLIHFVSELGHIAPTMLGLGNHDFLVKESKEYIHKENKDFFEKLSNLHNVYVLDNCSVSIGDMHFIGCTLPFTYYYNYKNISVSKRELNNLIPYIVGQIDKSKCNVLLVHSPSLLVSQYINQLFDISLVLCGHMHNGLFPNFIHFKNFGIIGPQYRVFPKYARGMIRRENTNIIISSGIVKFSNLTPKILHPFNVLYPYQIEYITIRKK